MAGKILIKMNDAGVRQALNEPAVAAYLMGMGSAVKAAADAASGGIHEVSQYPGRTRVRISVITSDYKARRGEATGRTLTRALSAARKG